MKDKKRENRSGLPEDWRDFFDRFYPEKIMNTQQAAEYLGISLRTVYRLIKNGEIPAKRVGGQWRLARSSLDKFIRGGEEK